MTQQFRPNASASVLAWLAERNLSHADLVAHIVATLHSPSFAAGNAGALQVDWPRIPVPADLIAFAASAALGRQVSALLDSDQPVPGVTAGALLSGLAELGTFKGKDYKVTAGWGGAQIGRTGSKIVMPRPGHVVTRSWTPSELAALSALGIRHDLDLPKVLELVGETACDVYLNNTTFWKGVPDRVWNFTIGGYQSLKKWLSYRDESVLERPLKSQEVQHFSEVVRRIVEILATGPAMDQAHADAQTTAIKWKEGRPFVPPPETEAEMEHVG